MSRPDRESNGTPVKDVSWVPNAERRRLMRAAWVSGIVGVASFALTMLLVGRFDARLLSTGELLPPDESLVWASLPWLVSAVCAIVLARAASRAVARVGVSSSGVTIDVGARSRRRTHSIAWKDIVGIELEPGTWGGPELQIQVDDQRWTLNHPSTEIVAAIRSGWERFREFRDPSPRLPLAD